MTRLAFETRHSVGTILWREPNRYEIRLRERGGRRVSTYVAGPRTLERYRVAERELVARIARSERGDRTVGRRLTVGAWLDQWLDLQLEQSPKTHTAYETRIRLYLKPVLGSYRLADLEPMDVTRAMAELSRMPGERTRELSAGTIDAAFRVLNAALNDAVELGKANRNACRFAKRPRPATHIEPPTQPELDRLFRELGSHPWRPVFSIMRWTGARHGEVLGLTWQHVNTATGELRLVRQASGKLKTRRSLRSVFVPPAVLAEINAIPRRVGTDLVFSTSSGHHLDERNVLRVFDAAAAAAGIAPAPSADLDKYRPHDLRHAFATLLLESGVAGHVVQAWLGHASSAMLDRYAHVRAMPGGESYRLLISTFGDELAAGFGLRPHAAGVGRVTPG